MGLGVIRRFQCDHYRCLYVNAMDTGERAGEQ